MTGIPALDYFLVFCWLVIFAFGLWAYAESRS